MTTLHPEPDGWRDRDFIDYPTGWWLADIVDHADPRCSYAQTSGAVLCDCGAIEAEWVRRRTEPAVPVIEEEPTDEP